MNHYADELDFTRDLAREASARAMQIAASVRPKEKSNRSYVTELDQQTETFLRQRIAARYPADRLTGEEYAAGGGTGPRTWSIDPIDGTGNLVHGLPLWAISIGLMDRGEPVVGVIALPPQGELFWASRGSGAWRDGERIEAAADAEDFHPQDNICVGTNALRVLDPRSVPGRIRDLGSVCCELVYTAMGRLTACAFLGEHLHDLAAGAVILHEAGCRFGNLDGQVLSPSEFLAATPVTVPTFIARPRRLAALMSTARRLP